MIPADLSLMAARSALRLVRKEIQGSALPAADAARILATLAVASGHIEAGREELLAEMGSEEPRPVRGQVKGRTGNVVRVDFR